MCHSWSHDIKLRDALVVVLALCMSAFGTTYYADLAASGANNGSSWTDAWQTWSAVNGALSGLSDNGGGHTILFRSGSWGVINENSALELERTDWLTLQADEGADPCFSGLYLTHPVGRNAWVKFVGINFYSTDSDERKGFCWKYGNYLWLEDLSIDFEGYVIEGGQWSPYCRMQTGLWVEQCANVTVKNVTGDYWKDAIAMEKVQNVLISGCELSKHASEGVQINTGSSHVTIEDCWIHDHAKRRGGIRLASSLIDGTFIVGETWTAAISGATGIVEGKAYGDDTDPPTSTPCIGLVNVYQTSLEDVLQGEHADSTYACSAGETTVTFTGAKCGVVAGKPFTVLAGTHWVPGVYEVKTRVGDYTFIIDRDPTDGNDATDGIGHVGPEDWVVGDESGARLLTADYDPSHANPIQLEGGDVKQITLRRNLLHDHDGEGIKFTGYNADNALQYVQVENNICYNTGSSAILVSGCNDVNFVNNIFDKDLQFVLIGGATGTISHVITNFHNNFIGSITWRADVGGKFCWIQNHSHNVFRQDPTWAGGSYPYVLDETEMVDADEDFSTGGWFVDHASADYRLAEGSPAIDAGVTNAYTPSDDFTKKTRSGIMDIGPYDAGGDEPPPTPGSNYYILLRLSRLLRRLDYEARTMCDPVGSVARRYL